MTKIKAGDMLICKEFVSFSETSFHYEGQLIKVEPGEEYYYNTPCNRIKYDFDPKNQNALRQLYIGRKHRESLHR